MNYLAIDTSGTNLTLAVSKNGKVFVYHDASCGVKHSVEVMPQLESLMERANFTLNDADFFAVVTGAGSFTGIRIGVSTVKALAFATNKPVLEITSFDTIAYNELNGKRLAVINAKHGYYYACGYTDGVVTIPPRYIDEDSVRELSAEYQIMAFEPLSAFENAIVASVKDGLIKAVENKGIAQAKNPDAITPLYIRKSQAEEGR